MSLFELESYLWNLGWILVPFAGYFLALGFFAGFRRWRVSPKYISELRANRSRLRKDRRELLANLGLALDDIEGVIIDDEPVEPLRKFRSSGRSQSRPSSRSGSGSSHRRRRSSHAASSAPSSHARRQGPAGQTDGGGKPVTGQASPETQSSAPAAPAPGRPEPEFWKQEPVEHYDGFGWLFVDWPDQPDDLKQLAGIQAEQEGALNDIGVLRIWQISLWKDDTVKAIAKELKLDEAQCRTWVTEAQRLTRSGE